MTYADWTARGVHLPVVEASVQFRSPARFDDVLDVETRLAKLRSVSLRFDYRLLRGSTLLAEGFTRLACVSQSHALQRFPEDILVILASPESAPPRPADCI